MKKLISSILMVTGTTVGGGMIILPAVIGTYGFYSAIGILLVVWFINLIIALIFLEANCYLPNKTNLISMSRSLLGSYGEWLAWIICLIFLYTILCAYITGMTEVLSVYAEKYRLYTSSVSLSLILIVIFSTAIYFGTTYIHWLNKHFVMGMFIIFTFLILYVLPHIKVYQLLTTHMHSPIMALPIVFTSFGFLIIIPSLRSYLNDKINDIKIAIIVGSFIPLFMYVLWVTVVMGVIPTFGTGSLKMILSQPAPVKNLINILIVTTGNPLVSSLIQIFILLAIASSFVGTSLGLYDFFVDGLKISNTRFNRIIILALIFIPPFLMLIIHNNAFMLALNFSGLLSTILFGLFPIILALSGRYILKLDSAYQVTIPHFIFWLILIFLFLIIGIEVKSLSNHFS